MKILITNQQLWPMRGTENWCLSVGMELIRRGHEVYVFSPNPRSGIPFFEEHGIKFTDSGYFDLILENHNVLQKSRCKGKCIIHTCHGRINEERPMEGAINVGVAKATAEYWKLDTFIPNGVDCERFSPTTPVNNEIKNVLSLCSSTRADGMLFEVCKKLGYTLKTTYNAEVPDVNELINRSDLVFGVGRSVLDAMACGRPVISFDARGYIGHPHGCGYVTPEMVRDNSDNMTGKDSIVDENWIIGEIRKFRQQDGIRNRNYIEHFRNVKETVDRYLQIYGTFGR